MQEKKALKEEKLKQEEKYMWAIVDGVKEKVTSSNIIIIFFFFGGGWGGGCGLVLFLRIVDVIPSFQFPNLSYKIDCIRPL